MLSPLVLYGLLTSSLVSANTPFSQDSLVKMLEPESFQTMLEPNRTNMVAFVSPSSSDYKQLVSDIEKAALGLHPFLPVFAVDCDQESNQKLCSEEKHEKLPTIKLFPRGKTAPSIIFNETAIEPSASAYYYWASRRIPQYVTRQYHFEDIEPWVKENEGKNAVLLLTKEKKVPLLWTVLANKYAGQLELAYHRDRRGKSSVKLGLEAGGKKEAKILIYPARATTPLRYEGINKVDSLSKFFDTLIEGHVNLETVNQEAMEEEFVPDEKELEIERKQEAQRLALAHGGFSSFIDFEKAIKEGHGADYHDINGYPGMMGEPPKRKNKDQAEDGDDGGAATEEHSANSASRSVDEL